jgi:transposase
VENTGKQYLFALSKYCENFISLNADYLTLLIGLDYSEGALSKKLKKLGYSFKKRQLIQLNKTIPTSKKNAKSSKKN